MKRFYSLLENKIKDALRECNYNTTDTVVTRSNRPDLGDYQYNGAMKLAKEYHQSPMIIADNIVNALKNDSFFKDINIANPGFINMTVSDEELVKFANIDDYEYSNNGKTIFLDYGGANVAKSLHVGHLRSANIGEALKRLCNYLGYNTISDVHLGDWGRPLGLVILELSKRHPDWPFFDKSFVGEYPNVDITNELLEEIYPYASSKSKEDEEYLKEAQEMTVRLQKHEKGIYDLWKQIMEVSKSSISKIYDRLNTTFDLFKGESDEEEYIPELLDYLNSINIMEDSEGAKVIFVNEEDDKLEIPPMLILKSDGGLLYSTTELATIFDRIKNYHPDEIIYLTDKRQDLHFVQAFRAAYKSKIAKEDTKLTFAGFGTMNGKDGKPFKTRDGGVMRLNDLLSLVKEECLKRLNPSIENDRDEIAEIIAMSAIKYADLLPLRESDYVFDIDKFCDLDGKTGPYILYSVVRMKSLLNKAGELNICYNKINKIVDEFDKKVILNINDLDLTLNKSFNTKSLNDITDYLYELITSYNRFYTEHIILKENNLEIQESWLYLTKIVLNISITLLNILAIKIPDKM